MKILHVFDLFSLTHGGGTVEVLYNLAKAQAQGGHEVTIFTSDFELDQKYIDSLAQVKVRPLHCVSSLGKFYYTPDIGGALREHLRDFEIVHLHCFRSYLNMVVHGYARRYGVPYIVDDHGSLPRAPGEGKGIKWALRGLFDAAWGRRILNDATRLVTENEFGARELEKFGAKRDRIAVIPLSFPVDIYDKLPPQGSFRKKYGLEGKHLVMTLGRINRIKGLDFLVESFHEMAIENAMLVMIGPDDGDLDNLKSLVEKLKLSDRVFFPGMLGGEAKLAALVDADVLVQPSRFEQAAWAPIEAVLCGTPVIVTEGTGSGEDISRMGAGYLVQFGDKKSMAATLGAILNDPAEAREKVKRARQYIEANLRSSRNVESYQRLYRDCIAANLKSRRSQ